MAMAGTRALRAMSDMRRCFAPSNIRRCRSLESVDRVPIGLYPTSEIKKSRALTSAFSQSTLFFREMNVIRWMSTFDRETKPRALYPRICRIAEWDERQTLWIIGCVCRWLGAFGCGVADGPDDISAKRFARKGGYCDNGKFTGSSVAVSRS